MKKYKDVPTYDYNLKDVQKRIKYLDKLPESFKNNNYNFTTKVPSYSEYVAGIKDSLIKDEEEFKKFFSDLAKISVSEVYKYDIMTSLNSIREVFEPYNANTLSAFIYIHRLFVEYPNEDLSIALEIVKNIIMGNKDRKNFIYQLAAAIDNKRYSILLDERTVLSYLVSSFENDIRNVQNAEKQSKIKEITSKYYEDFKQLVK